MDTQNQFDQYIEDTANKCLTSPSFASLPEPQKTEMAQKIKEHFVNLILLTTMDNLTDDQFVQIKDLQPSDPILGEKLEEFSSQMPFLAQAIQDKIDQDAQFIQQNGQLPSQE